MIFYQCTDYASTEGAAYHHCRAHRRRYANLVLETARKRYKMILVGDAGGRLAPEGNPQRNWVGHSLRVKKKRLTNASITLMTVGVFSICLSLDYP